MFTNAAFSLSRLLALTGCLLAAAVGAGPALSATGSPTGTTASELGATSDANPAYARTYNWDIAKSVDRARQDVPPGASATFNYTVTVMHDSGTDSNWQVNGEIWVENPNLAAVDDVTVGDAIDDPNATCVVSGGNATIPAGGTTVFDYACSYSAAPAGASQTNTATVSWPAQTLAGSDSLAAGAVASEAAVVWGDPAARLNAEVEVGDSLVGSLGFASYTEPNPVSFMYSYTFDNAPAGTCTSYDNTAAVTNDGSLVASDGATVTVCGAPRTCPAKVNFRWHYSANGTSGSWSGTKSTTCDGSTFTMGPQGMEGDLKLRPGTTLSAGYDFTIPGNTSTLTLTVYNPQVLFTLRCVSGAAPSQSTLVVAMGTRTYTIGNSGWYPSGDQHNALVYQGSVSVPNVCAGGQVRFDKGGTFSASLGNGGTFLASLR